MMRATAVASIQPCLRPSPPIRMLKFTMLVWRVISACHFPLWKRATEGDLQSFVHT